MTSVQPRVASSGVRAELATCSLPGKLSQREPQKSCEDRGGWIVRVAGAIGAAHTILLNLLCSRFEFCQAGSSAPSAPSCRISPLIRRAIGSRRLLTWYPYPRCALYIVRGCSKSTAWSGWSIAAVESNRPLLCRVQKKKRDF